MKDELLILEKYMPEKVVHREVISIERTFIDKMGIEKATA